MQYYCNSENNIEKNFFFNYSGNDMKKITTEYLLNHCLKNKKSLTPSRTLIINALSKFSKPRSAYELQKEIIAGVNRWSKKIW